MSFNEASFAWGVLAAISAVFAMVGFYLSVVALLICRGRRDAGGVIGKSVIDRDVRMLGALCVTSGIAIVTSIGLVLLLPLYGDDLQSVLEHLSIPVFLCYLGYTIQTGLASAVAPIWLIARWHQFDRAEESRKEDVGC